MSFLAVHRGSASSLATDRLWLGTEEWTCAESAKALLARLQDVADHVEQSLAEARDEARREGRADGQAQALAEAAPRLAQAAERAAAEGEGLRHALVELALAIVARVLGEAARPELVAAIAAKAAEALPRDTPARLRVHPAQLAAVGAQLAAVPGLVVEGDGSLEALDCVFETPAGRLLAGLPAQLDRLRAEMRR